MAAAGSARRLRDPPVLDLPPHLTESTGLSRCWDFGEGRAPEVLPPKKDAQGRNHYDLVKEYYRSHNVSGYDPTQYFDRQQTGDILDALGQSAEAKPWRERAAERGARINQLLWDDASGLDSDYNFERKKRRFYPFLTTFYPVWTGIGLHEAVGRNAASVMFHPLSPDRYSSSPWPSPVTLSDTVIRRNPVQLLTAS